MLAKLYLIHWESIKMQKELHELLAYQDRQNEPKCELQIV